MLSRDMGIRCGEVREKLPAPSISRVIKERSIDALSCLDRAWVPCHNFAHSQVAALTSFIWQTR